MRPSGRISSSAMSYGRASERRRCHTPSNASGLFDSDGCEVSGFLRKRSSRPISHDFLSAPRVGRLITCSPSGWHPASGLGDRRNGHLETRNLGRELCSLTGGWVGWKPSQPLFVHPLKVLLVGEDDRDADNLVHRTTDSLQDCGDVREALAGLLLTRSALEW